MYIYIYIHIYIYTYIYIWVITLRYRMVSRIDEENYSSPRVHGSFQVLSKLWDMDWCRVPRIPKWTNFWAKKCLQNEEKGWTLPPGKLTVGPWFYRHFLMEIGLPTQMTARVYVNLPEGNIKLCFFQEIQMLSMLLGLPWLTLQKPLANHSQVSPTLYSCKLLHSPIELSSYSMF